MLFHGFFHGFFPHFQTGKAPEVQGKPSSDLDGLNSISAATDLLSVIDSKLFFIWIIIWVIYGTILNTYLGKNDEFGLINMDKNDEL